MLNEPSNIEELINKKAGKGFMTSRILVTGVAGFIGFHVCKRLLEQNVSVIGIDNINDYYDINLKKARLRELEKINSNNKSEEFIFFKCNLEDKSQLDKIFKKFQPNVIIHLAAQAGVRYSIKNPSVYISSNLVGFGNILESCRKIKIDHFLYASSSSIYGGNKKVPFSESDFVDSPVSLYAATKKANELMAHSYSHLYKIPCTGIRFFTVYGPWGRPDMALMIFTKAILASQPIRIFNHGKMYRDFTFIDDVTEAVFRLIKKPPSNESLLAPSRIINIGNNNPTSLKKFVEIIEKELKIKAIKLYEEIQLGEVEKTYADIDLMKKLINYHPTTPLEEGIKKFLIWYKKFYRA